MNLVARWKRGDDKPAGVRKMAPSGKPEIGRMGAGKAGLQSGARLGAPDPNSCSALPTLRERALSDRAELFRRKLQACSTVFDSHTETMLKEKEAKRQTLL